MAACLFLLHSTPEFLWKQDYDKSKVVIYTVSSCLLRLSYTGFHDPDPLPGQPDLLPASGQRRRPDLLFNVQLPDYNYVFAKSEEIGGSMKRARFPVAQRYFEKNP